jgi:hypothetical protein
MIGYSPRATQIPVIYICKLPSSAQFKAEEYLFRNFFQVPDYKVVALRVIERRKAPGVFEGNEVRFLWMIVEMYGPEASDLLACHLRAVDALLQRGRKYCHAVSLCSAVLKARLLTRGPYQEEPPVSSLLELGHETVDDVRLGCDDVYSVHVPLGGSPLLETFNVWACQDGGLAHSNGHNVLVMLRLRMSSSLTTLSMSFLLSSSTMSIFHCLMR